jgi:hypothetical protein
VEKLTITHPLPAPAVDAVTIIGALGTASAAGVTGRLAESGPDPTALPARTLQLTVTPPTNPETVMGELDPVALCVPQVAVYPVIGLPPLLNGALK